MATRRIALPLTGLGCGGGGALDLERSLIRAPGVRGAYVNPASETAYISYDPDATSPERLADIVERAGLRTGPLGSPDTAAPIGAAP